MSSRRTPGSRNNATDLPDQGAPKYPVGYSLRPPPPVARAPLGMR